MMGASFCEGLAAHREYEALRSRGMAHERALRQALGLGCSRLPRATRQFQILLQQDSCLSGG
jgi:hypothetical protein